jgi:hypothetical protein
VSGNLHRDIAHKKLGTESLEVASVYIHATALGVCGREMNQMSLFCGLVSSVLLGSH